MSLGSFSVIQITLNDSAPTFQSHSVLPLAWWPINARWMPRARPIHVSTGFWCIPRWTQRGEKERKKGGDRSEALCRTQGLPEGTGTVHLMGFWQEYFFWFGEHWCVWSLHQGHPSDRCHVSELGWGEGFVIHSPDLALFVMRGILGRPGNHLGSFLS